MLDPPPCVWSELWGWLGSTPGNMSYTNKLRSNTSWSLAHASSQQDPDRLLTRNAQNQNLLQSSIVASRTPRWPPQLGDVVRSGPRQLPPPVFSSYPGTSHVTTPGHPHTDKGAAKSPNPVSERPSLQSPEVAKRLVIRRPKQGIPSCF